MTLRGDLTTMPATELFDWIDRRELTGEVKAKRGDVDRRFLIANQAITLASSNQHAEYLGQILIGLGYIDEEQLRRAQAAQEGNALSLGKSLLAANQLSERDLRAAIELKIKESLFDLLSWPDGTFVFEPGQKSNKIEVSVTVPLRDGLIEGDLRAQEWRATRALIPNDDARFFIADWRAFQAIDPRSPEGLLLQEVTRGLNVREIMQSRRALPSVVYHGLGDLAARGVIKFDRRRQKRTVPDSRLSPDGLLAAAHGRAQGGDARGALALARKAVEKAPRDKGIEGAYLSLERQVVANLVTGLLSRYSVPRVLRAVDDEQDAGLATDERWFLSTIDGHWDLLTLLRGSKFGMVDSLLAMQRLVQRGLVGLVG